MADPLAFGFMPMQQAQTMNWEQSSRPPSSADVLMSLLEAQRAQSQQNFHNSPFGPSFERRFGAMSPLAMLPGEEAVPPQVGPSAEEVARLQAAVQAAAQANGQFTPQISTRATGATYTGPALDASSGTLQSQPWYDEYLAAAQQGVDLPAVVGSGGTPRDMNQAAAYRANRQRVMNERQANVQSNALMQGAARRQRMTGLTDPRYVEALMEALGGANGMAGNAYLYGPEVASNMRTVDLQAGMASANQQQDAAQFADEMAFKREALQAEQASQGSPWQRFAAGVMGQAVAGGNADLNSLLPQLTHTGAALGLKGAPEFAAGVELPLPAMKLEQAVAASNGDPATYLRIVRAMGGNQDEAAAYYTQRTGKPLNSGPGPLDRFTQQTGILRDISFSPLGPVLADIPGVPKLSDLFRFLQPEPAGLNPRLRGEAQQAGMQP